MIAAPISVILMAACALTRVGAGGGEPGDLDLADHLVDSRAEEGRLGQAIDLLRQIDARSTGDPRVQGRLSWALFLRDEGAAPSTGHRWEEGVGVGWTCLVGAPAFATAVDRHQGRITDEVAARVPTDRATCLLGLVAGWSRRVQAGDPAAMAIDLDPLRALADRAAALVTDPAAVAEARRVAARVRLLVPPELGGDPAQAATELAEACEVTASPGCWVDLATLALDPREDRWTEVLLRAAQPLGIPEPVDVTRARQQARDLLAAADGPTD